MRTLWRIGIFPLLTLLLVQGMWGQEAVRVYPANAHPPLRDVVVWNGDTFVACGLNSAILLSPDRGATWKDVDVALPAFSVYQATRTGRAVYLLAIPKHGDAPPMLPPPGYASVLLRYVPSSGEIRRIDYPRLAGIDTVVVPDEMMMRIGGDAEGLYLFCTTASGKHQFVRSRDEGESWEDVMLPDSLQDITTGRFIDASDGRIAFLAAVPDGQLRKIVLLFPEGPGGAWRIVGDRLPAFDPAQAPLLWDGDTMLSQDMVGVLHASSDGGRNWQSVSTPPFGTVAAFVGRMTSRLFAFTAAGQMYVSADRGVTWSLLAAPYASTTGEPFRFVAVMPDEDAIVTVDNAGNIHRSSDGGLSWDAPREQPLKVSDAWNSHMADVGTGYISAIDRRDGERRLFGTTNGCRDLRPRFAPVAIGYSRLVLAAPDFWYGIRTEAAGGDTLVYRSTDQGRSWDVLLSEADCPGCAPKQTDIRSTSRDLLVFPTTAGLRLSTDGGAHWPLVYPASWELSRRPMKVVVDAGRAAIWMLPDATDPWHIVRGRIDAAAWDTVYTMPPAERGDLLGIAGLFLSQDGEISAVAYSMSMSRAVLLRSNDGGGNWERMELDIGPLSRFEALQEISVLPNRSVIAYLMRSDPEGMTLHRWMLAADGMQEWNPLFERCTDNRFGAPGAGMITAGASDVFFLCGTEIFHSTTPGVSRADVTPALPSALRIPAVWPQPLPADGMLHARIESATPGHARLELHDLLGRRRATPFDGQFNGRRDIQFSMAGLEAGVYLLRLISGGESVVRVVVKR